MCWERMEIISSDYVNKKPNNTKELRKKDFFKITDWNQKECVLCMKQYELIFRVNAWESATNQQDQIKMWF